MSPRALAVFCFAVATASAAPAPTEPPVFDKSFQGASFTVLVQGTWPTTYQWYRGTEKAKVKIPAPEGIQRELILKPTDIAGPYFCVATNAAGSSTSPTFRLSFTSQASAADMQVTIKQGGAL